MISTSSRYAPELPIPAWDRRGGRQLNATFAVFRTITPPPTTGFKRYLWKQSDRWDLLAVRFLGSSGDWHLLLDMNPEIQDPHQMDPGTVIRVPG